jgi:molecular chaperone DnaJ
MVTDLYLSLGVSEDSSPEQIRAAYLHWTKELQPDQDSAATHGLQKLQDAFAVLGHPARRRVYDEQRSALNEVAQGRRPPGAEPLVPSTSRNDRIGRDRRGIKSPLIPPECSAHPSFDELFARFWSNFDLVSRPKAERLESLTVEIPLTGEEARSGGDLGIMIPARARCPACGGHGAVGLYQCWHCEGHGAITADHPLHLRYPAGIRNHHILRVPLERFGISNFYLTVRFRVSDELAPAASGATTD